MNQLIFDSMFKQITATILLLTFSAQVFCGPFIMLDYFLNTTAYAKNCVNKAKPKMHCNGKCQMMQKIQEQEKKEQQNAERKAENKLQVLYSKSCFTSLIIPLVCAKQSFSYMKTGNPVDRTLSVFHPPQA